MHHKQGHMLVLMRLCVQKKSLKTAGCLISWLFVPELQCGSAEDPAYVRV
jgi:hypothetical protein